jgi:hypothetical protein
MNRVAARRLEEHVRLNRDEEANGSEPRIL